MFKINRIVHPFKKGHYILQNQSKSIDKEKLLRQKWIFMKIEISSEEIFVFQLKVNFLSFRVCDVLKI
jgi:hypothetical protein